MSHTNSGFASLGLAEPLLRAIQESGYSEPTPIQSQSIPVILEGHDILAAAQTGTGKTAGFTVPILQYLFENKADKPKPHKPRCLILTPTRELAAQIGASVQVYGKHVPIRSTVVFGGVKYERQVKALRRPTEIVIATPGRLLDLVNRGDLNLSQVEVLVLDEADRMLDMGFIHDVKKICSMVAKDRQTLMFSATFSKQIRSLAKTLLHEPKEVSVAKTNVTTELVKQTAHYVDKSGKRALVSHLITENKWDQVLVFTRTKHGANRLAQQLTDDRIRADAFHGNKSQAARTRALDNFKHGKIRVLVATDIAARGIDIHQLPQVVNFDLPLVAEDYVHRIGRTGRAGSNGQAVSLVGIDELKLLAAIEKLIKQEIDIVEVEGFTGHTGSPAPASGKPKKRRPGKSSRSGEGGKSTARKPKSRTGQVAGNTKAGAPGRKPKARTNQRKSAAAGTAPFKKRKTPKRKPRTSAA